MVAHRAQRGTGSTRLQRQQGPDGGAEIETAGDDRPDERQTGILQNKGTNCLVHIDLHEQRLSTPQPQLNQPPVSSLTLQTCPRRGI